MTSCVHYCNTEDNNEQTTSLLQMSSATPRSMTKDCHISRIRTRHSWATDYKFIILVQRWVLAKVSVYLSDYCTPVAAQQHVHFEAHHQLTVLQHRLSTCGCQTFSVAGSMTFNGLSDQLCDPSVNTATFTRLKTYFSRYKHVQCIRGADVMHYIKHYKLLKEWFL